MTCRFWMNTGCWSLRYLHERLASWRFSPTLSYVAAHRIRVIDILDTFLKLNSCRSYFFLVTVPFSGPLWGIRETNITEKSKNTLRFFATTSHAWSGSKLCIRNMEHDSAFQLLDVLDHICHQVHWNAWLPTMSFNININFHKLHVHPQTNANHVWILEVFWIIHTFFAPTIGSLSSHVGFERFWDEVQHVCWNLLGVGTPKGSDLAILAWVVWMFCQLVNVSLRRMHQHCWECKD